MTARQLQNLYPIAQLTATAAALFTNAINERSIIRRITLFNSDSVSRIVQLWRVPDNGAGGNGVQSDANQMLRLTIPAATQWQLPFKQMVLPDEGDAIFGKADSAAKVTIKIDGVLTEDTSGDEREFKRLVDSQYVPNAVGTVLTLAASLRTSIREVLIHNKTAVADLFKLYAVPNGDVAGDANQIWEESIEGYATRPLDFDTIMETAGDTLQADAASANTLVISADGIEADA